MLQKTAKNILCFGECSCLQHWNHLYSWERITQTIGIPSRILTMKQMFDVSAKLVSEQDEIYGVKTLDWENSSWKYLSLIGDEQVISLQRTKSTYFQILYCVLVRYTRTQSNTAWE